MIDIDQAAKWADLFARVGFPAAVAFYLLWRLEGTLGKLTEAVLALTARLDYRHREGAPRRRAEDL
jgi:FAD/FMN-containing dehydrogenase